MNDFKYVGIPFQDGGRGPAAFDCWGLVLRFLSEEAGIKGLPDYGGTTAAELAAVARDIAAAQGSPTWRPIDRRVAKRFDVVTMVGRERIDGRMRNLECHVGVLVDPARVLHIEAATDSVIVRLDHVSLISRIAGFYRHKDLA